MCSLTTTSRPQALADLLHRTALIALLTLGAILATACGRPEAPPPTVERSTAVAADQSGATPSPDPSASPSPVGSAARPSPSPSPSPLAPLGTLAEVYPDLRSLAAAASFTITEKGGGMIAVGTVPATTGWDEECTLTRTQTDFAGTCFGRAGISRMFVEPASLERRYELPVHVPLSVAERFLRDLTTVPVADGPYRPIRVADHRSHVEFAISSNAGPVRFFRDPVPAIGGPWAVEYGGRQMVIVDPAAPSRAYGLISPYFDEFKKMTNDELREMNQALAPSPSPSPAPR